MSRDREGAVLDSTASAPDDSANRAHAVPNGRLPKPNADAAALPIGRSPKPSGFHSSSKSRPSKHILDPGRTQQRRQHRVRVEGARYTLRTPIYIRRRKPPARRMQKEFL
jgi:hypothetical protein